MKGTAKPVERQKPHVREVVAMLRDNGASDIVVTQPKHYRIDFVVNGVRVHLAVSSTPSIPGHCVTYARRQLRKALDNGV